MLRAGFYSGHRRKKVNKINRLKIKLRPENPRVGGSIPPLATSKIKGLDETGGN